MTGRVRVGLVALAFAVAAAGGALVVVGGSDDPVRLEEGSFGGGSAYELTVETADGRGGERGFLLYRPDQTRSLIASVRVPDGSPSVTVTTVTVLPGIDGSLPYVLPLVEQNATALPGKLLRPVRVGGGRELRLRFAVTAERPGPEVKLGVPVTGERALRCAIVTSDRCDDGTKLVAPLAERLRLTYRTADGDVGSRTIPLRTPLSAVLVSRAGG